MRRLPIIAAAGVLATTMVVTPLEASTLIAMPPPPAVSVSAQHPGYSARDEIDLGAIALHRYSSTRVRNRAAGNWSGGRWGGGPGWGGRWRGGWYGGGGWGGGCCGPWIGGGYRISLSPFQVFGRRMWNGGYVLWP